MSMLRWRWVPRSSSTPTKQLTFAAMGSALDQDRLVEIFAEIVPTGGDQSQSVLHGCHAKAATDYIYRTGATQ